MERGRTEAAGNKIGITLIRRADQPNDGIGLVKVPTGPIKSDKNRIKSDFSLDCISPVA